MYARTEYPKPDWAIPENYGGTALHPDEEPPRDAPPEAYREEPHTPHDGACDEPTDETVPDEPVFLRKEGQEQEHTPRARRLSLSTLRELFRATGDGHRRLLPHIHLEDEDREDLLLLAIAALLFFSPNGDKGCALILVALILFL